MSWHIDHHLLDRYVASGLDEATAWSVEQHLATCARCRDALAGAGRGRSTADERVAAVWDRIELGLDAPRPTAIERLLVTLGVREHQARLLAATPSLTTSWLLAVGVVLASTVGLATFVGGRPTGPASPLLFLLVAPLVPLAGVAAAYGPGVDPTYEIGVVAPLSAARLLFVRATAVLATSFLLAAVAALLLFGGPGTAVAAWMLPALAVSVGCLAASTWTTPLRAASGIATGWVAIVVTAEVVTDTSLAAFGSDAQLGWSAAAGVAAVVLWRRSAWIDPAARR